MSGFKRLEVWKLSMRLADDIYDATQSFPKDQQFGLAQQMQRCAISVPSNIAEGSARAGKKEFVQFLYIARGSLAELETQLILAYARKYLAKDKYGLFCSMIESVNKMLTKLIQSQKPKTKDQRPWTI
ncbi:MAG: four helix bundle protein [Alphaproteobacteria bacterium]|nr:four helix bundle protein [Alphaproteobacteria bacterium]